ncbi:hypothetical protein J6590_039375 [Homalodisca vitripennis]|nr:hypothetical protein J6590_039375 [Homalodisca vitripennis]
MQPQTCQQRLFGDCRHECRVTPEFPVTTDCAATGRKLRHTSRGYLAIVGTRVEHESRVTPEFPVTTDCAATGRKLRHASRGYLAIVGTRVELRLSSQ